MFSNRGRHQTQVIWREVCQPLTLLTLSLWVLRHLRLLCLRRMIVRGMAGSSSGLAVCRRSDRVDVRARVTMSMTSA